MNKKVASTILLVILAISMSLVATAVYTPNRFAYFGGIQEVNGLHKLAVSIPLAVGAGLNSSSASIIDQPTRIEINNFIKSNPGVHFRGICDGLALSIGVVQYHLNILERVGLVACHTDGQNKRYFENGSFTKTDITLISLIKHQTTAKILVILSQNNSAFHKDIAHSLGMSSQALTWQMNQLKKTGLIYAEKTGINVKYSLNDANIIKFILDLTINQK